jgi:transposase
MSKALSADLRSRVLAMVKNGASHRAVGRHYGVSPASVSRWQALDRDKGNILPGPLGGDRRSARIEQHHSLIRRLLDQKPDASIHELQRALSQHGHSFGYGTLHRFFKRHNLTRKKRQLMPQNKIVQMCR